MAEEEKTESTIKRSDVATPLDVEKLLKLSPKRVKELQFEQEQLLAVFRSRARLNPEEQIRARGVELEQHYRQTGNLDGLASALEMQGRYKDGAKAAKDKELTRLLHEKARAVDRSDRSCKCDDYRQTEEGYLLPAQFVESYGYSLKHKAIMPFIRCLKCNQLNARPMPQHLSDQQQMRRQSEKLGAEVAMEFFRKVS